jgi:hypothetical protein
MKKVMLSLVAIALAAGSVIGSVNPPVKKAKAKQATCTSCPKGQQCSKTVCTKPACCK